MFLGLFVIQILCLIASFFLLFSSVMLIYGVHTVIFYYLLCFKTLDLKNFEGSVFKKNKTQATF